MDGLHPNDLCYVIPIIKTEEQFWLPESERGKDNAEITDVPQGFKTWVANNQDRIARAEKRGTLPYFVRDNRERVKILKNTQKIEYFPLKNDSLINNKQQFSNIDYTIKSNGTISANNNVEKGIILEGNLSQEDAVNILRGLCNKYTHEEAFAFLDDGRIFYKKGVLGEVPLDEDEKMLLKNSIFMHNHPETIFSPNDILTSIKYGFKEIHVITSTHKYIAITSDFDLSKSSLFKVREMYNDALSIVYDKIMSSNSKIADKIRMNMQLYESEEFLRLLGIRYIIKPF